MINKLSINRINKFLAIYGASTVPMFAESAACIAVLLSRSYSSILPSNERDSYGTPLTITSVNAFSLNCLILIKDAKYFPLYCRSIYITTRFACVRVTRRCFSAGDGRRISFVPLRVHVTSNNPHKSIYFSKKLSRSVL